MDALAVYGAHVADHMLRLRDTRRELVDRWDRGRHRKRRKIVPAVVIEKRQPPIAVLDHAEGRCARAAFGAVGRRALLIGNRISECEPSVLPRRRRDPKDSAGELMLDLAAVESHLIETRLIVQPYRETVGCADHHIERVDDPRLTAGIERDVNVLRANVVHAVEGKLAAESPHAGGVERFIKPSQPPYLIHLLSTARDTATAACAVTKRPARAAPCRGRSACGGPGRTIASPAICRGPVADALQIGCKVVGTPCLSWGNLFWRGKYLGGVLQDVAGKPGIDHVSILDVVVAENAGCNHNAAEHDTKQG